MDSVVEASWIQGGVANKLRGLATVGFGGDMLPLKVELNLMLPLEKAMLVLVCSVQYYREYNYMLQYFPL